MADSAGAHEAHGRSPETVDRIMVGVCGAIWLVLLAVTAIAIVALVELGRGHHSGGSGSSWLLYSVIVVSAVIIIGAIPLLLRARRNAAAVRAGEHGRHEAPAAPIRPTPEARAEKVTVFGTAVDPYERARPEPRRPLARLDTALLDRLWLRGTVSLLGATGLALTGVAAATYLLAQSSATAAWVALGFAAVIAAAMPALLVFFQRQVGEAAGGVADVAADGPRPR